MIAERDVAHIAELADIGITKEELEEFTGQFNQILGYFEILDQVTAGESGKGGRANVFREDEVVPSLPQEDVLSNTKDPEDGFFRAPRVM